MQTQNEKMGREEIQEATENEDPSGRKNEKKLTRISKTNHPSMGK